MRLDDGRIIPDFIAQALQNAKIVIYGDEHAASTFCYVNDVVDCIIKMMASEEVGPLNAGSPQLYRLVDVAHAIIALAESASSISFEEPLPYRNQEPLPDISLARERLGWVPITPLENGLAQTIKYMQANRIVKFNPDSSRVIDTPH
jgi:UDP-glucuronate decarboxylase